MVSVSIRRKMLEKLVGQKLSDAQLLDLLPRTKCVVEQLSETEALCEVTGDRPDLLGPEGVARALKGVLGKETGLPVLEVAPARTHVKVGEGVSSIRPFIVAAFARGVKISAEAFLDLIQVQEKLHLTHGRRRRKVAIGIHDASKVNPPFSYKTAASGEVAFIPLGKVKEMSLKQILEEHEKGVEYAFIFKGVGKYPLVLDSKNHVVSFPPIINASRTEVTTSTKDLFIEITGTDFEACNSALNIICQNYADHGAVIESVEILYPDKKVVTPVTDPEVMTIGAGEANKLLGTKLSPKEMAEALSKQRIGARAEGDFVACEIPRYRTDFLHPIDLVEEIALGIGINSLVPKSPSVFTKGSRTPLSVEIDALRDAMSGAGFLEVNTIVIRNEEAEKGIVFEKPLRIQNPVSSEYGVIRNSLLPSLLDVLSKNTLYPYPQKLFEAGEVVEKRPGAETETVTKVNLCAVSAHKDAGLSEIASVLAVVFKGVSFKKADFKQFIPGRCAQVLVDGKRVGVIGEVHPEVCERLGLFMPVSVFEASIGEFV